MDDSVRRLFGRRYLSGAGFTVDETAEDDRFGLEADESTIGFGRRLPADKPETDESSFAPDLLLKDEKSDDEDDVVETEGAAGYLERLGLPDSPC